MRTQTQKRAKLNRFAVLIEPMSVLMRSPRSAAP